MMSHHSPCVLGWEDTSRGRRLTTSRTSAGIISVWKLSEFKYFFNMNDNTLSLSHMLSLSEFPADWVKSAPAPSWRKYCSAELQLEPNTFLHISPSDLNSSRTTPA